MALMSFKKGVVVPYIPAYGGNREHKVKTVIGILPLNNDGSIDFMDTLSAGIADCENDKEKAAASKEMAKQAFIKHVDYVKNYTVMDEDGNEVEIKTGADLYSDGSRGLINEITIATENSSRLSEGQAKNFSGDSAGSEK